MAIPLSDQVLAENREVWDAMQAHRFIALLPCRLGWGWSIGAVAWAGLLSAGALLLVALFSGAPRLAAGLAVATAPVALAATAAGWPGL